jgi:replicative DNA helicase
MSDLRDGGAIEQDAFNIYFLYRPEYYGIMEDADGNSVKGLLELIVAKGRIFGGIGTALLWYDKKKQGYVNDEPVEEFNKPYNGTITTTGHAKSEEPLPF